MLWSLKYLPINENHPINVSNTYTHSKLICEELCKSYNRDSSIDVKILRLFNVYGKNQNKNFLIPTIINQLKNDKIILKDSSPIRDFVHVNDVVDAITNTISSNFKGFEILNIGSGKNISKKQITDLIKKRLNKNIEINFLKKKRKNEIYETLADVSKAKKSINWVPKIDFEEGLFKLF